MTPTNGSQVAYTLGRTSAYSAAMLEPGGCFKMGRVEPSRTEPNGYEGGWVWLSFEGADDFRRSKLASVVPDWDPKDFSVYELHLPNGWSIDVSATPGFDGIHHLLCDSPVIRCISD